MKIIFGLLLVSSAFAQDDYEAKFGACKIKLIGANPTETVEIDLQGKFIEEACAELAGFHFKKDPLRFKKVQYQHGTKVWKTLKLEN